MPKGWTKVKTNELPDVWFGHVGCLPDFEPDDDPETAEPSDDVIALLGFDPTEEDRDASS